ncbi:MAG TPA: carboxy terminal-processing peptidase [Bacteroidia bacterium]|jgi:carboxyl-terminal processing protease
MKRYRSFLILPLAAVAILVWAYTVSGRQKSGSIRKQVLLQVMTASLNSGHYQPMNFNNDFSEKTYKLYLDRTDPGKKFFLASDVKQFEKYRDKIDEEVNDGTFEFFDLVNATVEKRIKECEGYYKDILAKSFDFTADENFETDPDKSVYPANSDELKEAWRKYLKYQVMVRVNDMTEQQEKAKEKKDTVTERSFAEMEEDARKKVLKSNDDLFKRLEKISYDDRLAAYLNTITNIYDPHTEYFPVKDKKNFDIMMSGQLEGIGAQLQEKDGFIKVSSIVPGSASWRQGQLKAGDIILKVAQGTGEPVDVMNMDIDDAVQLIRGKKGTEVRLTVKKVDGSTLVIPIIRDIVVIEETYAKSAILKTNKKIGYIHLPSFYADFDNPNGRFCAPDVKNELLKLEKENVEGVILDLRDNGGGSLQDVVKMVGLFIPKGPVVQVKQKQSAAKVLSDNDPSVVYDGPLVVMVNENSASASEIFAAAVQDYGRGVIIGSNTSFGKGTVQQFLNLDDYLLPQFDSLKPLGSVKLTIQKFYRISGGSTQLRGVTPDIILPDLLKYYKYGEKELEYPMQWDEIAPASYDKWKPYDLVSIRKKSEDRINNNPLFNLVDDEAKRLKQRSDNSLVTLNFAKYHDDRKKYEEDMKKYDAIDNEISGINLSNPQDDMADINSDTLKVRKNKDWLKSLKKDIYLYEASSVVSDMK